MQRRRFLWLWAGVALLAAIALVGSAALSPRPSLAAPDQEVPRTLSLVGQGTMDVRPDRAVVTLGVNIQAPTAGQSYSQASEVMNRIVAGLTQLGVAPEDVQTADLNLYEERRYDPKTGEPGEAFYRTSSQLRITTRDLTKLGKLVDAALEAGANSLQGIQFTVVDTEKYVNEAIDKAVDDAKAKAARVAGRLGVQIGQVRRVTVHTGQSGPVPPPIMFGGGGIAAERSGMPVLSGTVPFQATVEVEFDLQ